VMHTHSPRSSEAARSAAEPELEAMLAKLRSTLEGEQGRPARLRALPSWLRALLPLTAALMLTCAVFAWLPRDPDFQFYPPLRLTVTLAAYAGLLWLMVWSALRPLQRVELSGAILFALGVLAFVAPFALAAWPDTAPHLAGSGPRKDCFAIAMALGGAVLWLIGRLDRVAAREPRVLMLGAAAGGLAANLALVFHCTDNTSLHLLLVHAPSGLTLWWVAALIAARRAKRALRQQPSR
jgi:hypothetical protein